MMDSRLGARFRNVLLNLVNHRETNLVGTGLLTFAALYISWSALLNQSLLHPLTSAAQQPLLETQNASPSPAVQPFFGPPAPQPFLPVGLFLLWALALGAGRLCHWLFLPSLLGPLLVGICLANFASFRDLLPLPGPAVGGLLFEFAFLLALIRAGLSLDSAQIRRQLILCSGLAFLCPLAECLAVLLLAHFAYDLPLGVAVLFGFSLAPTSPAVIVPAVLRLRAKEIGTESGVPTAALCSTALDNVLALTGFAIAVEFVSIQSDELSYTLTRIPVELLVGAIFGMLAGLLLRSFPRPDAHWAHFQRGLLLLSGGAAFHLGTRAIGCPLAGPVAVFLMAAVAAMHWQLDNHRRTRMEENGFRLLWELLASPLLFLLLGSLLNFSANFSLALLPASLAVLVLGILVRFAVSMACAFGCFGPWPQERLFLGISLLPKGTLQASFVPILQQLAREQLGHDGPSLPVQTCLLALLVGAPLGEMLIRLLGPLLVRQKLLPSSGGGAVVHPAPPTVLVKGNVTHSDPKDNRLRLELGPTEPPKNAVSSPPNQQMRDYSQFRAQRENAKL